MKNEPLIVALCGRCGQVSPRAKHAVMVSSIKRSGAYLRMEACVNKNTWFLSYASFPAAWFLRATIASTIFLLTAPAWAAENKFVYVPQTDSPGNDYSSVENSSFEDCAQKCDVQRQCNAFTYSQLHSVCFLKLSANRATTFYALATTGVKLSPTMQPTAGASEGGASFVMLSQSDSPGNDYSRVDHFSQEECRHSCDDDKGCNAFTYNLARGVCFLKRAANQWTNFNAWAVTGIKLSASPPPEQTQVPQQTAPSSPATPATSE
jgi:hypothetical protein